MRITDLAEHFRAMGFGDFTIPLPVGVFSFLASPMFHWGARVGHVFVGYKDDDREEFTQEDEETLAIFASQTVLVIAKARTYRGEQRARKDLETLVNTSPVGVVVLDAATGNPVSVNREAMRIVDGLLEGEHAAEDLLEVVTCARADGREISLRDFTLVELLNSGEMVRAGEVAESPTGGALPPC